MRKPTRKMIEALVELFDHRGTADLSVEHTAATRNGLIDRGLIIGKTIDSAHRLTDSGLRWLVDNRHAVIVLAAGTPGPWLTRELWEGDWVRASVEPMTHDQVTAARILHGDERAQENAVLDQADAIRSRRAELPDGFTVVDVVDDDEERADVVALFDALPDTIAALEAEELSYRDQGLIEGTAAMLAEGRGSAITNLADGGRAWTPVDRVGEFDRASRRAPEAAWERGQSTPLPVTGFLPTLNAALTPGESELLDRVNASDVSEGDWLASSVFNDRAAIERLVARGLAYRGESEMWRTFYLTAVGAQLVKVRRAIAAAKDSTVAMYQGIADTIHAADLAKVTGTTSVTVEQIRGNDVISSTVTDDQGAHIPVLLTITRLRRGLVLSSADRTALADLLDTVRRSIAGPAHPDFQGGMVFDTYVKHFGNPR